MIDVACRQDVMACHHDFVPDRLSPLDVSFLYFEEPTTPMHVGGVAVFEVPEEGFDLDRLVGLITQRIAFVPRYRQRIKWVPGRLANPVWVDDEDFDISYHVRRSALPRPGSDAQLAELVARVQSRPLDRSRPLWEMYLVEGLAENRFAIISKTHHAMVDGVAAVDIGQVILDTNPVPRDPPPDTWRPAPEPSWAELVAGAVAENVRRPAAAIDSLRGGVSEVLHTAGKFAGAAGGLLAAATSAARPAPESPLNVPIGEQRRYAMTALSLDDHRRIRKAHDCTVNDVVLATVAGALRAWLLTRGEKVSSSTTVRALVPVSVRPPQDDGGGALSGNRVSSYLVDLPVGEPSAVMRLHQVSYRMQAHKDTGQAVGAEALAGLAGFAPPTMHSLGARVASGLSKRWFNLVVTNVPGPQQPLYAGKARMLAAYPVVPLAKAQALSIGLTSYDGRVFYGLNADRDAMPDVGVLAQCLEDALTELLETVR
jgi:WS/DGAT/MGAT family acyltransferase